MIVSYLNADQAVVTENGEVVTLEDLLIFFTGASKEPPLGFHTQPVLMFIEGELATASTCDLRIRIPFKHETYEQLKKKFKLSLKGNDGLGIL